MGLYVLVYADIFAGDADGASDNAEESMRIILCPRDRLVAQAAKG